MHLKKIKLAGFKSFVDPTTIHLRSKIAAIVGPNGCGKSNVIDAIRWVMGESSAKQLRGTAMADVIFNGSTQRKPLGQASIELVFDNSDAGIGGEYAQYNEISVRREIARDGVSDYYLNGTHCRRRDIIDIFLGTGLGPNSYAIIEQGTISQFVEAKPDDLRLYLEEAAGISKYKERRYETENRIRHTRENLSRLNDIRLELEQQLKHLKNQANAAERYKKLKHEERQTKAELHVLNWRELQQQLTSLEMTIADEVTRLEDKNIAQQGYEIKINLGREQHQKTIDDFNVIQEQYYRLGSDITRLEQQLQHEQERKKNLTAFLAKLEQSSQETVLHQQQDQGQLNLLQMELNKLNNIQPAATELLHDAEQNLHQQERQMREFQQTWDTFNLEASHCERNIEVNHTKIQHTTQTITNEKQRLDKLRLELTNFTNTSNQEEIKQLDQEQATLQGHNKELHEALTAKQQEINQHRELYDRIHAELNDVRHTLQILAGKYASLESLQQAALGKNDSAQQKEHKKWLQEKNLINQPRLLQELKVESGWEKAVAMVLANYLDAICVDDIAIINNWQNLPVTHLVLCDHNNQMLAGSATNPITDQSRPTLLSKLATNKYFISLLAGIYIADDLAQALKMRASLASHESIITKDGIWLGVNWLSVTGKTELQGGIILREREIKTIKTQLQLNEDLLAAKEKELQQQQDLVTLAEQQYHEIQQKLRDVTAALGKIQGAISVKQNHATYLTQRQNQLQQEILQHENQIIITQQQLASLQQTAQIAINKRDQYRQQHVALQQTQEKLQQELHNAREQAATQRKMVDTSIMRLEMLQTQIKYLQQNLDRANKKISELTSEHHKTTQELNNSQSPILAKEQELQQKLNERFGIEKTMQSAKQKVNECENLLRQLEEQRTLLHEENQALRNQLEKLRLEAQELKTKKENYVNQVAALEYVVEDLLQVITTEATIVTWEEKLSQITTRIERLGAINLAAIDEFTKQNERKEYLDQQNQDLVDALTTLESAINKIDRETKEQFRLIFDEVNQKFQTLFPSIFGGGKAYLELSGDNLLESGVAIFAQPPGKRNSSIHLLSGGEKALTAIALIFAIFQRNPAPFCILDEVDAPLDDTNIARFCSLVKEIAASVQLIFISHNKLTLEIADQLTGVTMQEPGVSRIVTVDVQQALEMVKN